MPNIGCWILVGSHQLLVVGGSLFVAGCWIAVAGCRFFFALN
jgi:hypothetical protein